jgi:hypothetical protein
MVYELGERTHCPSWTGGLAVPKRKYCEATTVGTDGVVVQTRTKHLNNHPVRSSLMLRDIFSMSRPPLLSWRGDGVHHNSFTPSE